MTSSGVPVQDAPITGESAPRVHLVVGGGRNVGMKVHCRRVVTLLGSRSGCKVTLRHKSVSPVHVAIVNDGEQIRAADLVTPSGTYLNGLKLEHEVLNDGDVLGFGPWEFRVEIQPSLRSGLSDAQPFGLDAVSHAMALEHITTRRILQPTRDVCIIGRRNGCDIAISDSSISRTHAILVKYLGRCAIFDLLSKHHTFVNDAAVGFKFLQNNDLVTIGESSFRVRFAGLPVGEAISNNGKDVQPVHPDPSEPPPDDLIDIERTEGSQRWRIAENVEKVSRKR